MSQYHINPNTGNPNKCTASVRGCPYGGSSDHFFSKEEARQAYETKMNAITVDLKVAQDEIAKKREEKQRAALEGNGLKMNPYATENGDRFLDENGDLWETGFSTERNGVKEVYISKIDSNGKQIGESRNVSFNSKPSPDDFEELKESRIARLERDLDKYENSPARNRYDFPEYEMIRYNINQKIKEIQSALVLAKEQETLENDPSVQAANNLSQAALAKAAKETQYLEHAYGEPSIGRGNSPKRKFQEGKSTLDDVVVGNIQYNKVNPGATPTSASEAGTKTVIVPNVKRLTDKKRIEIGTELWRASGRNMDQWHKASEKEKVRFSQTHMGRAGAAEVEVKDGKISWSTQNSVSSGHDLSDVQLFDFGSTS